MTSLSPVSESGAVSDVRDEADSLLLSSEIDFAKPSPARMYDYYLGGKDNLAVDREAADKALSAGCLQSR